MQIHFNHHVQKLRKRIGRFDDFGCRIQPQTFEEIFKKSGFLNLVGQKARMHM
jgi:hypothetical protein